MPDSLQKYAAKRDFARTPEPKGKRARSKGAGTFVVQKHDASRLHYDFRLAIGGVMPSWAVPKGPSLDPSVKRLAVRTEDHPIEYGGFEGIIPAGQYGGGTVMIWDEGRYEPEGDAAEGLEAGELKFTLHGERLKGGFALIRLKRRKGERQESWLLVKERDQEADPDVDIAKDCTTSAATGRSMEEIAAEGLAWTGAGTEKGRRRRTPAAAKVAAPAARSRPAPAESAPSRAAKRAKSRARSGSQAPSGPAHAFVAPQLATLVTRPPTGRGWIYEPKLDGYRMIAAANGDKVVCYTRRGQDWTRQFAPIAAALRELRLPDVVLDGEVVVADKRGRTDFGALQRAIGAAPEKLSYQAFDCLFVDGEDLRDLPVVSRKNRLAEVLAQAEPPVQVLNGIEGDGAEILKTACSNGIEGVIAKKTDAPYRSRRVRAWLKLKCEQRQELVIGGWSPSSRGRPFASLLLGAWDGGDLRYAGRVGTGWDEADMDRIAAELETRARRTSPFTDAPADLRRTGRWVEPTLVAEVRYTEMTADNRVRHAVFLGLRKDKDARDVVFEKPEEA